MKPVARFKPYRDTNITRLEKSDMEVALEFYLAGHNKERFLKLINEKYTDTLDYNKKRIEHTLKPLYKRPIKFSDKITSEVISKIHMILKVTDKNIPELVEVFNSYLKEEVCFFKGGVPISPETICNAYKAIQNNSPVEEVKQILYK